MKTLKPTLIFIGTAVITYLIAAFIKWDFNPINWIQEVKSATMSLALVLSIGTTIIYLINQQEE